MTYRELKFLEVTWQQFNQGYYVKTGETVEHRDYEFDHRTENGTYIVKVPVADFPDDKK